MADSTNTRTSNNKNDARELYLSVEPEQYERHHSKISIIIGHFALRHLNMIYQEFEGDLIMPMVFGEIAHHNILKFYSRTGRFQDLDRIIKTDPNWKQQLAPCNAYSIIEATGIPRETVRRKVDKLLKKGWLTKNSKGEIFITDSVGPTFMTEFNRSLLQELLDAYKQIRSVLESDKLYSPRKTAR